MKHLRSLFAASVATNVVLLVALAWPRTPTSSVHAARATDQPQETVVAALREEAETSSMPPDRPTLDWTEAMAELRRAGVPSPIIARLVEEKVAQKWTLIEQQMEQHYLHGEIDFRRVGELHDERRRELEAELRLALGDGFTAWDKQHTVDNMYLGGLVPTAAQRDALYPLQKHHLARLHELEVAKRNGELDEQAFAAARAKAEDDYKARLAGIIGADRVDGLSGREDPVVQVQRDFARLQLSPKQMQQLTAAQQQWMELRVTMEHSLQQTKTIDAVYESDLQAIDRVRDEEFRQILGAEAFDAWQKNRDDRYSALRQNAPAWGLDESQIDRIFGVIRDYDLAVANFEHQAQARAHAGQPVDWDEVEATLATYTRQTETVLRQHLGDDRFEQMQRSQIFGLRAAHVSP